jgi:predicted GNAT family acetyltransferase
MNQAMICAEFDNPAALHLHQSVGFEKKYKLNTYIKTVRAM